MPLSFFAIVASVMTLRARCVVASGGRVLKPPGRCAKALGGNSGGNRSVFPIAEPSRVCKLRIGKLAPYLATAIHAIFPKVANRPPADFKRNETHDSSLCRRLCLSECLNQVEYFPGIGGVTTDREILAKRLYLRMNFESRPIRPSFSRLVSFRCCTWVTVFR